MLTYRSDIDGLRAIALLSVILFHYKFEYFTGGFVGVDIFFVISGYLITTLIKEELKNRSFSFKNFYVRRMRRLFPAFILHLILTGAVAATVLSSFDLKEFGSSAVSNLLLVSNIFFWSQSGYFNAAAEAKPLLHTWSLNIEEQFYLVWPLILVWTFRNKGQSHSQRMIIRFSIISFFLAQYWLHRDPAAAYFFLPFRIFEFGIGATVALGLKDLSIGKISSEFFYFLGLVLISYSIFKFNNLTPFPSYWTLIPCMGTALIIHCGSSHYFSSILKIKPLVALGLWSYSIYLYHWPIYVLANYFFQGQWSELVKNSSLFLSIFFGFLSYKFIEQPFRLKKDESGPRSSKVFISILLTTSAFVGILAANMSWTGWSWRINLPLLEKPIFGGTDCPSHCVVNQNSSPITDTVVVIGDSHSRSYLKGLEESFPTTKFIFFGPGGCDFYSYSYSNIYPALEDPKDTLDCQDARQKAFAMIKQSPKAVILAQYWKLNSMRSDSKVIDLSQWSESSALNFITDEIKYLKQILKIKKLILFGTVPTLGANIDVYSCLTKPFGRIEDCEKYSRMNVNQNQIFVRSFKDQLDPSILILDPFDFLCDVNNCFSMKFNKILYSDQHHLSVEGSQLYIRSIAKQLEKYLQD